MAKRNSYKSLAGIAVYAIRSGCHTRKITPLYSLASRLTGRRVIR